MRPTEPAFHPITSCKCLLGVCAIILLASVCFSASTRIAETRAPRKVQATFVSDMPRFDGHLDENVWQRAGVASDFIQFEPEAGQVATKPTFVRVAYTKDHLLIAARLVDEGSTLPVSTQYHRDARLDADDRFEVYIDTYHDRRNGYYFATNPAGTQLDAIVRDSGAQIAWEWDGVWWVSSTIEDSSWSVEIAIPFSTLRFMTADSPEWGVNFGRFLAHRKESSFWSEIRRDLGSNGKWHVPSFGALVGLEHIDPSLSVQLKPYVLGGLGSTERQTNSRHAIAHEIGVDGKVLISPSLSADLTVNTDFAQVEADQVQTNLTRLPLLLPEKRDFFLEGAGLFHVGESSRNGDLPSAILYFSRRIGISESGTSVPILAGARLTGKFEHYDLGVLSVITDDDLQENQRLGTRTSYTALRAKRELLGRSSIGALILSKSRGADDTFNHVFAVDGLFSKGDNATLYGFVARSITEGRPESSMVLAVDGKWITDRAGATGSFSSIDEDFTAAMGFVPRTGIRRYRSSLFLGRRPNVWNIRRWNVSTFQSLTTKIDGSLESQLSEVSTLIQFHDGSYLSGGWTNTAEGIELPFPLRENVTVEAGKYRFNRGWSAYRSDPSRVISANALIDFGRFYSGALLTLEMGARFVPHRRVSIDVSYSRNSVELPYEGGNFIESIAIVRSVLALSPRATLKTLIQFDGQRDKTLANVTFRLSYRPGSDLFVVFNDNRRQFGYTDLGGGRELLAKLTFYLTRT